MENILLQVTPNQEFSLNLENNRYDINIRSYSNFSSITIKLNDVNLIQNQKILPNTPLIPEYLIGDGGNFIMFSENGDIPFYTDFEVNNTFHYLTNQEFLENK